MNKRKHWFPCIAMLLSWALLPTASIADAHDAEAEMAADAATWGIYTRLPDRQWISVDGEITSTFTWSRPGEEIEQQVAAGRRYITRGSQPGELLYREAWLGGGRYIGHVQADGSVVFESDTRLFKTHFRIAPTEDGGWQQEWLKLKDGQLSVRDAYTRRFRDAGAPVVAGAGAAAPATPAVSAPAPIPVQAPASPPVPAMTPAGQAERNFGILARHDGMRLVGNNDMLEIQMLAPDTLAVQFFGPDGKRWNRYLVRAQDGKLVLAETAIGKNNRPDARLDADGTLHVESQDGWFHGWRYAYTFKPDGDGIAATKVTEFMNGLRIALNDGAETTQARYRPLTQERVQQALETSRQDAESARIARENRLREQAERQAMWNAALQGLNQGAAQGTSDYLAAREQQDAFLAQTTMQAQAIADQAQRQREEDARRAAAIVAAARTQPEAAAPQPPAPPAEPASVDTGSAPPPEQRGDDARATAQAEAERKRQADAAKQAEEQARQRQQQQWRQSLQQARSSLGLRADTCIGGGGRYYVIGPKTSVNGCVSVHYEARCPGTPAGGGVQGSHHNYVGGSCMGVGDAIAIPGSPLSCPADQVLVTVTDVTGCD